MSTYDPRRDRGRSSTSDDDAAPVDRLLDGPEASSTASGRSAASRDLRSAPAPSSPRPSTTGEVREARDAADPADPSEPTSVPVMPELGGPDPDLRVVAGLAAGFVAATGVMALWWRRRRGRRRV